MGGHNRLCPSLRWAGMVDKQIFARDVRDMRDVARRGQIGLPHRLAPPQARWI